MVYRIAFPFIFVVTLCIILFNISCVEKPNPTNNSDKDKIHEKIKEDLADGLSHPITMIVDESYLPNTKWVAERGHSSISFQSRHWEIVDLIGFFDDFEAIMYFSKDDFSDAVIYAKANTKSIIMPNIKMAASLINEEYFHANKYPFAEFRSESFKPIDDANYQLSGYLKIKDIENPIELSAQFNGYAYPEEKKFAGFAAKGAFSRFDYNVGGKSILHSGKLLHSDSIYFQINLRMEEVPN